MFAANETAFPVILLLLVWSKDWSPDGDHPIAVCQARYCSSIEVRGEAVTTGGVTNPAVGCGAAGWDAA